jgi:hypothetical protein
LLDDVTGLEVNDEIILTATEMGSGEGETLTISQITDKEVTVT